MKIKVVLHLPHTSLKFPKVFYKGLVIDKAQLNKYNLEMTDFDVDKLFSQVDATRIKAKYSRLFCDVEKFKDEAKEEMARFGEGVIYTKMYDGTLFHKHDETYAKKVYKYYDKYHKNVDRLFKKLLRKYDKIILLDCHSFSDEMAKHFFEEPFPDVCIGIDKKYFDKQLLDKVIAQIENKDLSYKINYPYKGVFIPNFVLNGEYENKVSAIMLEINKRVYL